MNRKIAAAVLVILSVCLAVPQAWAQTKSAGAEGHAWWQDAVFYEVYPRSFADSDNNGIGDLRGITSKLDYLKELGVNAIWITPCFPSPQVDFGYDVSDYEAIDPMYGTLADFDKLVAEAKKRGIRVILDFVVNHTSDQHKWFINSKSSRTAEKRAWYIWRDGKGPGQPPNNWLSTFGTAAWTLDPKTNQYYYHYFYPQQPDLNWRNPAVEKAMLDVTRFWYKRGVAGFRLDAVDTLYEDPNLTDDPEVEGTDRFGRPSLDEKYNKKLPEVHDAMRKLRSVADEYGAVLIGETWTTDVSELKDYYGAKNDELQMPMDLLMTGFQGLHADEYRKHLAAVNAAGHWPTYVITNHDIVRSYTRYGDGKHNDDIAKMMAAFYMTLRGSVIMYYGEEIGMENNDPKRREDVQDPEGKIGWPKEIGRDGERTPMQWTDGVNAGFSKAKPWLPVPESAKTHNVSSEMKDPNSMLSFYRQLLAMRHTEAALRDGEYISLNDSDAKVLTYLRKYKDEAILVVVNMSASEQKARIDLSAAGIAAPKLSVMLTSFHEAPRTSGRELTMEPYSAFIAKVGK
ncbi:MAG TPA: alpha-glucosidase [Candidatus Acidoferrum sp.]|nr:alpha-glucosidase [Candidatus Acidoferrum sp.]